MLMRSSLGRGETDVTFLGVLRSHGRWWNAYSDGTVLPAIAGSDGTGEGGGEGGSGEGEGGSGSGGSGGGTGSETLKLTAEQQVEVDRIIGQRVKESERAAVKKVAEQLGMSPAEAAEYIQKKQADDEAAKTEEQKRLDEIAERERKAEERDRQAAERERQASIREALAEAGAVGDELRDAAVLIAAQLDAEADDDAIADAVDKLKKRRAELFKGVAGGSRGTHTDTGSGGGGGSGGGNGGEGKTGGAAKLAAGEERAREFGLVKGEKKTA